MSAALLGALVWWLGVAILAWFHRQRSS
jgi:hypothetical protein